MSPKNLRQLLAALLTLSISISISACGDSSDPDVVADDVTTSTAADTTVDDGSDSIPALDFDGAEILIGTPDNTHYNGDLTTDEQNGEVFNDALWSREQNIEERFNVNIEEEIFPNGTSNVLRDNIIKEVAAGDCTYDFCMMTDRYALQLALQNTIYDMNEIPYVDTEKPYWTRQINDAMRVGGRLYFLFGDISMTALDYTHLIAFNSRLISDYSLENPYDLVRSGEWTYDKFADMAKAVTSDLNGNSIQDEDDMYGFVSAPKQILPCFWIAAGEQSIKKDDDGYPYFSIPADTRFADVFDRIYELIWDTNIWYVNTNDSNTYYEDLRQFQEGHSLFAAHTLYTVGQLRDMVDDFGVLPYPKWDESQPDYYSRVEGGAQVCIVPITNADTEVAGAVIEAMCSYSYQNVIPAYYEMTIKAKYSRDDDSAEMFDLILANRTYDLGDTFWCEQIRDGIFAQMFKKNDRTLMSTMESKRAAIEAELEKVNSFFRELG